MDKRYTCVICQREFWNQQARRYCWWCLPARSHDPDAYARRYTELHNEERKRRQPSRRSEADMAYRYEVFPDASGQYRWRQVSRNGEIVATSEAYTRRADAYRSIYTVAQPDTNPTIKDVDE